MTDQRAYGFRSESELFAPRRRRLYAVVRGEPSDANHGWGDGKAWSAEPGRIDRRGRRISPPYVWTANWDGYTPVFCLVADGRLVLERFDYDDPAWPSRRIDEWLLGNFYAIFKRDFMGDRLCVLFEGGRLVPDRTRWIVEMSDRDGRIFVRGALEEDDL